MSRSNGGRDSFDRLLTDGSQASRTKDAKQKQGALPVWTFAVIFGLFGVPAVLGCLCSDLLRQPRLLGQRMDGLKRQVFKI